MDEPRGIIRNRAYASQIRDFSGMRFGNITPTDIDGFIEYHDKGYVFVESKYGQAKLPYGQRLALQRLIDSLNKVKPSLLIIASHMEGTNEDIDMGKAIVTEYRSSGVWVIPNSRITVYQIIKKFLNRIDEKGGE